MDKYYQHILNTMGQKKVSIWHVTPYIVKSEIASGRILIIKWDHLTSYNQTVYYMKENVYNSLMGKKSVILYGAMPIRVQNKIS